DVREATRDAESINSQIAENIGSAVQPGHQLSVEGQLALQNDINARLLLQTRLGEATIGLNALISAIDTGAAAEIAVAAGNAQTAATNLNTATSGATSANPAHGTHIAAAGTTAPAHPAPPTATPHAPPTPHHTPPPHP